MIKPDAARAGTRPDRIFLVLLALGLVLRMALAWAPFEYLAHRGPLVDDAFYAFSVARSVARGEGPTADGIHPTSGFQPLYTLLLVPLYRLFPGDETLPIHLALTLLALCGTATGWLIFRIARRFVSRRGALFALFLWTFSPALLAHGTNGLETGLSGFFLALSLDTYLGWVRPHPEGRRMAVLGVLLGLTVLARVDMVIFAAALGADLLRLPVPARRRLSGAATALLAAGLIVGPYVGWMASRFSTLLPESGPATRFLSLCYGTRFVLGAAASTFFEPGSVPPVYYLGSLRKAIQTLVEEPLLFPFSLPTALAGWAGWLSPRRWLLVAAGGLLFAANFTLLRRPDGAGEDSWKSFHRIAGACVLLWIPAYAFGALGQWWFPRYFFPVYLLFTLYSAAALDRLGEGVGFLRRLGPTRFALLACALHGLLFAAQAPELFLTHKPNLNVSRYIDAAKLLDASLSPGSRAGAFQSGALGYFSRCRVINLDGVVNQDAARALREKRMAGYIRDEGIEAVIDWPWILEALLIRRSPPGEAAALGSVRRAGPFLLLIVEPPEPRLAAVAP